MNPNYPYAVFHEGPEGCGKILLMTKLEKAELYTHILAEDFCHKNGTPCEFGEDIVCDSCGKPTTIMTEWVNPK